MINARGSAVSPPAAPRILSPPLRVSIVGAGPAGIHAAGALAELAPGTKIDMFERLPTPYGLVRYGLAPGHAESEKFVDSLHTALVASDFRLFCNVEIGKDLSVEDLRSSYDAVIIATGAPRDALLDIPGVELPGSFGAADFVGWYNDHPDAPQHWPLHAESVAVIGGGNVALDVTRMLLVEAQSLQATDVSDEVREGIAGSRVREVHIFVRRGPADARFSPNELRALGELPGVDVVVDAADVAPDRHIERMTKQLVHARLAVETLRSFAGTAPADRTAQRRVHLHFYRQPVEILGNGKVEALRVERTDPDGYGHVTASGVCTDYPVQAAYRAIGFLGTPLAGVPFDHGRGIVSHRSGAVVDESGLPIAGLFVTGWMKRGAAGLIGAARPDARQTVETMLRQLDSFGGRRADRSRIEEVLAAGDLFPVDWEGWLRIDAAEKDLGVEHGRPRVKIGDREELVRIGTKSAVHAE
ncbi:pyridine nucleotide-disulfide oxidoreductase [Rhodococcus erythropolis]|uniref:FAD-dependent oxidoreductase n=1 Tax=Rhodococcus erythropolis TaxID=1833 RepID=UPI00061B7AA6|nr:FAD-dependent oxidoreductase [Rhodococcus erythropolis]AKD96346.1 pyridine nucleotide-disulfide oxidoreductase [Rhodococcus erythropolis]